MLKKNWETLVNEDPYGEAWFIKIKLSENGDFDTLLTADEYQAYLAEEANQ